MLIVKNICLSILFIINFYYDCTCIFLLFTIFKCRNQFKKAKFNYTLTNFGIFFKFDLFKASLRDIMGVVPWNRSHKVK